VSNQTKAVQLNDVNAIIYFIHFRDGMYKCLLVAYIPQFFAHCSTYRFHMILLKCYLPVFRYRFHNEVYARKKSCTILVGSCYFILLQRDEPPYCYFWC